MAQKSWPEERKEIALWLSGYLSMFNNWVEKILDDDDTEVDKGKIVDFLSTCIAQLEEEKLKIIKMKSHSENVSD
tara:strand:- start:574 stop:798 length:225 start_codon:yes stop_codon:yes gene_type:complete